PRSIAPAVLPSRLSHRRVSDAGALPGTALRLRTAWVMLMLPLARLITGANETDGTVRSGSATLTAAVSRVLFVSSASVTTLPTSVIPRLWYEPAAVSGGMRTAATNDALVPAARLMVRLDRIAMSERPLGSAAGTRAKPTAKPPAARPTPV